MPESYIVELAGSNFAPGGVLENYSSSSGANSSSGPYEPAPDVVPAIDSDDNGSWDSSLSAVQSAPVTLSLAGEPTGETDMGTLGNGNAADNNANLTVDFGLFRLTRIGDLVWEDRNGDGRRTLDEPGIGNVAIKLLDGSGALIATTSTDADGWYEFAGLTPGDYQVEFIVPAGYEITLRSQGDPATDSDADASNGRSMVVTMTPGLARIDLDVGLFRRLSLGDLVWEDLNGNGTQDAGEPGLAGVTVNLLASDGTLVASTVTGSDGTYRFDDLRPGLYRVEIETPAGYLVSRQQRGSDSGIDSDIDTSGRTVLLTAESGTNNLDLDAGLARPATIGNIVWIDSNGDGIRDNDETGLFGLAVNLYDENNTLIAAVLTGQGGSYSFRGLLPGTYVLEFVSSNDYVFSPPNQADDSRDSDVDPQTGRTPLIVVSSGETSDTWHAGLVPQIPTAIMISSFGATWQGDALMVRWATSMEIDAWGFRLYRSADGRRAGAVQVTPELILARGRGQGGALYEWADRSAKAGMSYSYWLEEVEIDGSVNEYGPLTMEPELSSELHRLFLPLIRR